MYEFNLIVNIENSFERFMDNWESWKQAIISYSKASRNKPKLIQQALDKLDKDEPG